MNYEGFKQYVADHIKEFLPQDYSVHEIGITKQRKNNDVVLDALSIKGDSNIVPVIYLEPYYQAYTDGVRMDDILQKIADMYMKSMEQVSEFPVESFQYDKVKNSIFVVVQNAGMNQELLEKVPHELREDLAPADKKLYALRDVTATVDNMSLIASSIMSKKLAAGADAIVLDVKTGSGAFMKSREDAFALAEEMVKIGKNAGRKTIAVISDMDQPLGRAVGNALEVKEAIATLRGEGPEDFKELCMVLGSRMLLAGSKAESVEEARNMLTNVIRDGSALRKLEQFVEAQGGDPAAVTDPDLLPKASMVVPVCADRDGFVEKIACEDIGICSLLLGGGRETKESEIDLSVGILLEKKKGDAVKKGEVLGYLHANDEKRLEAAKEKFRSAYFITGHQPEAEPLIKGILQ